MARQRWRHADRRHLTRPDAAPRGECDLRLFAASFTAVFLCFYTFLP